MKKIIILFIILNFKNANANEILLPYLNADAMLNFVASFLPQNPIILEAGGFDGEDTIKMHKKWPNSIIHVFEPVPEIYNWLSKNVSQYNNINSYPLALSDKNEITSFNISEHPSHPGIPSMSSSLLLPKDHLKYSEIQFNKKINVKTITIDDWAKLYNITKIDFIWLDLQGIELPVLKQAIETLKNVKVIVTEVELVEAYAGQALYEEVKSWLENNGFYLAARNFKSTGEHWFGDAIFIKKQNT